MPCSCDQVMIGSVGMWSVEENWFSCGLERRLGKGTGRSIVRCGSKLERRLEWLQAGASARRG